MSPIDIVAAFALLILVLFLMFMSYRIGRQSGEQTVTPSNFRRPVNTFLFYKAPVPIKNELSSGLRVTAVRGIQLPENFDARQKWQDAIGEALDQGTCGSCWAFASATAIADRFRIAEPDNTELRIRFAYCPFVDPPTPYTVMNTLSPYELVNCDICEMEAGQLPLTAELMEEECDMGCEGGYITHVYKYIAEHGITTMVCTPPTCDPNDPPHNYEMCDCIRGPTCRVYKPRNVYGIFTDTDDKPTRVNKAKEDLFAYGPITTGFTVYNSFYQFFDRNPNGIYTTESQPPGDLPLGGHAVDIVGWGVDPSSGIQYWLCRNSWGTRWGDHGFFRIQYDWGDFLEPIWMGARI